MRGSSKARGEEEILVELVRNERKTEEIRKRARRLVAEMTLEEKVSQMMHAAPAIERLSIKAYNWWNEAMPFPLKDGESTMPSRNMVIREFIRDLPSGVPISIFSETPDGGEVMKP